MALTTAKQITLDELAEKCLLSLGRIKRLYLHWTAGRYDQVFDDYHLNIGPMGELYLTCKEFSDLKQHTWRRNTASLGIALCCGYGAMALSRPASPSPIVNFGPYPPTQRQIEALAIVIAMITHKMGLDINEETVLTHQEAASLDGYGPGSGDPETRWDLWLLPDEPVTKELRQGGRVLRGKALCYRSFYAKKG